MGALTDPSAICEVLVFVDGMVLNISQDHTAKIVKKQDGQKGSGIVYRYYGREIARPYR
jgi:hypothetical protein